MLIKGHKRGIWPGVCKYGKLQSPILLKKRFAYQTDVPALKFENFKEYKNLKIENTGDTVRLTFPETCHCKRPKISKGGLVRSYTLNNIHFHWPAEHIIDGIQYDLEMHLVFYADNFQSYEEALKHPWGITVLSILFLRITTTKSKNFRIIADAVKELAHKPGKSKIISQGINLYHFLPYDHQLFYHYRGSLTTPHCLEFVHWIVMKNSTNIGYLEFKDLCNIYDTEDEIVLENNRLPQPLNERIVSLRLSPY